MATPDRGNKFQHFDERLLSQNPDGKECYDTCLANGWTPRNGDVIRLMTFKYQFKDGKRSEYFQQEQISLEENKIALFYRWLYKNGRLASDTTEEAVPGWEIPHFLELTSRGLVATPALRSLRRKVEEGLISS